MLCRVSNVWEGLRRKGGNIEVPTSDPMWAVENHQGSLSRTELAVHGKECRKKGRNIEVLLELSDQLGLNRMTLGRREISFSKV